MSISYQGQYADILGRLVNKPLKKVSSRIGDVRSNFVESLRVDLTKEFPLMEIKKIKFSNVLHELLWFIKGQTNIKYLIDNDCNIWTDDAYRYYLEKLNRHINKYELFKTPILSKEQFIEMVKTGHNGFGELDRIYGKQWREFNGKTDQLQNCINTLKTNPDDRRMIVTGHNPTDIEDNVVGLPSCHNMFQFYTIPLTLDQRQNIYAKQNNGLMLNFDSVDKIINTLNDLNIPKHGLCIWFNIRSNDFLLGQPYNMASYALLCHIIANIVNMIPFEVVCSAIDCHLYEAHIPAANEYILRYDILCKESGMSSGWAVYSHVGYCKSELKIMRKLISIDDITVDDFVLINYNPQSYIKAPLLT